MNWGSFKVTTIITVHCQSCSTFRCDLFSHIFLQPVLADAVVAHLEPIQKKYFEVMDDPVYLDSVLRDGQESADELAEKTLRCAPFN
jgi:hypothetical protein